MDSIIAMLGHMDMLPIVYGLTIWLGLIIMIVKFRTGYWLSLIIDIAVFVFVFKLHGGTMSGAFAATIAAMLAGITVPFILGRR
jgi:hypothetical protein